MRVKENERDRVQSAHLKDSKIDIGRVRDDSTLSSPSQQRPSHDEEWDASLMQSVGGIANDIHEEGFAGAIGPLGGILLEEALGAGLRTASYAIDNLTILAMFLAELMNLFIRDVA